MAEGVIAGMLIWLAGDEGLNALQQVITVVGLPIFCLVFAMIPSLIRGFRTEDIDHVSVGKRPGLSDL